MPLALTASCFSKIQIGFTLLIPADPASPGKRAVKRVCVCVRACVRTYVLLLVIIIQMTIFMVLSSWLIAVARVHLVHLINADSVSDGCQPSPSQTTWAVSPSVGCYHPPPPSPFYCYTAQNADTHFTITQRVEDGVDLGTAVKMQGCISQWLS